MSEDTEWWEDAGYESEEDYWDDYDRDDYDWEDEYVPGYADENDWDDEGEDDCNDV